MKHAIITIAKFGISFAILGYLFWQAWQQDQFQQLAEAPKNLWWLTLALVTGLVTCTLAFVRWYFLVRALEIPLRLFDAIRLGFLGHLFNLMSVGVLGGDAIKAVFAARKVPSRAPEAVASIAADRIIGLLTMFAVASVAYLLADFSHLQAEHPAVLAAIRGVCRIAIVCTLLGIAGFGFLLLMPRVKKLPLVKRAIQLPKIGRLLERLVNVALVYRHKPGVLALAMLISLICNFLFAVCIYSVAAGISNSYPSFASHFVIAPIAMVANAVPLPGGLGGMEFALDFMYRGFSQTTLPSDHGFVVALGFRFILLTVAAIGVVVYLAHKREIRELSR